MCVHHHMVPVGFVYVLQIKFVFYFYPGKLKTATTYLYYVLRNNYGLLQGASHYFPPHSKCAEHNQIQPQRNTEEWVHSSTTPLRLCLQVRTKVCICNEAVSCSTDHSTSESRIQRFGHEQLKKLLNLPKPQAGSL